MKQLLVALLLAFGLAESVWAMQCPSVVSPTTTYACTQEVFNDSGSALTSGTVVVWDNDDTEFDRNGYPYVTTTTSADHDWTAGVILDGSCADQTMCQIVVSGFAWTKVNGTLSEDTVVATSTTAGQAGDHSPAANTCSLGSLMENYNKDTAGGLAVGALAPVYVRVNCP